MEQVFTFRIYQSDGRRTQKVDSGELRAYTKPSAFQLLRVLYPGCDVVID